MAVYKTSDQPAQFIISVTILSTDKIYYLSSVIHCFCDKYLPWRDYITIVCVCVCALHNTWLYTNYVKNVHLHIQTQSDASFACMTATKGYSWPSHIKFIGFCLWAMIDGHLQLSTDCLLDWLVTALNRGSHPIIILYTSKKNQLRVHVCIT